MQINMFVKTNLVKINVIFYGTASCFGKSSKVGVVDFCMAFVFLQCDILITANKLITN